MEGEYRREAEQHRPEAERRQHQEVLHPLSPSGLPMSRSLSAHCFSRPFLLEGIHEPQTLLRPQPLSAFAFEAAAIPRLNQAGLRETNLAF